MRLRWIAGKIHKLFKNLERYGNTSGRILEQRVCIIKAGKRRESRLEIHFGGIDRKSVV